jgi:hypothetical protein
MVGNGEQPDMPPLLIWWEDMVGMPGAGDFLPLPQNGGKCGREGFPVRNTVK